MNLMTLCDETHLSIFQRGTDDNLKISLKKSSDLNHFMEEQKDQMHHTNKIYH